MTVAELISNSDLVITAAGTTVWEICCLGVPSVLVAVEDNQLQSIQKFIENIFKIDMFSKEVYYLSSLPSRLDYFEVLSVIVVSLIISFISTLLPAYRASKLDPIKTIKNE